MHPIRRRKKRPNYGVRTVEVSRGKNGFGFTISGQQPCILSCIVAGSPAESAGLRAGDYLVAVDGRSVSKVPHDDVVRLIGCSSGVLKLQIAENYYSDSSDDDVMPVRPKPKYMHKPRSSGQQQQQLRPGGGVTQQNRIAKVVRDLRTGAMFEESLVQPSACVLTHWSPPPTAPTPPPRPYHHVPSEPEDEDQLQFVVGYLGTIEIPKQLQPGSKLQIVCACIRKLRAEKRTPSLVLMTVLPQSIRLTDARGASLADYPASRVLFCSASSDADRRHFGLVTSASSAPDEEEARAPSSACHVFAIDPKLAAHGDHLARAEAFKLDCAADCQGFPKTSDPILRAIQRLYIDEDRAAQDAAMDAPLDGHSPQPSNASSTNSSNSDSGIGFRDDCGNHSDPRSDRILVVDVEHQRLHIQHAAHGVHGPGSLALALSPRLVVAHVAGQQVCSPGLPGAAAQVAAQVAGQSGAGQGAERLTVRAMPDPVREAGKDLGREPGKEPGRDLDETLKCYYPSYLSQENLQDLTLPCCASSEDLSLGCNSCNKTDSVKRHELAQFASLDSVAHSMDSTLDNTLLSYKLSPKVFGLPRPVATHSLEDLTLDAPRGMGARGMGGRGMGARGTPQQQQWGSLQELRSFVVSCFEAPLPPGTAPLAQPEHEDGPVAEEEREEEEEEEGRETGGVASWSAAFERLLADPAGLHTFAEFLKKEFSHENIYFWVACERYRHMTDWSEQKAEAQAIFDKHLCLGAPEPVNVDSHARQVTQEQLGDASQELFLQAQKQIFNLMKFDSYPRFIKSELYKECLLRELSGQELPFNGSTELDQGLRLDRPNKLKKSRSDAEDRRRKSLLPWHRKNRSKSKDRGESEYSKLRTRRDQYDTVSIRSDVTSSRSSLASWDLALRGSLSRQSVTSGDTSERENSALCRVILPDGATTVVQTRHNETVSDMVQRLLEKRGLNYQHFQVFVGSDAKAVAADEVSTVLSNKEVRVEPRVVFRLDLPNRKTVGVKSRPGKTLGDVLRPVLHKYGYRLHLVSVTLVNDNEAVSLAIPVSSVDNQRLQVLIRSPEENALMPKPTPTTLSSTAVGSVPMTTFAAPSAPTSTPVSVSPPTNSSITAPSASLDEITNRVFEELLQGKAAPNMRPASDQGSVRSEDWGSEHSSGIFGRLLRRDSAFHDKSKDSRGKGSKKFPVGFGITKSLSSNSSLTPSNSAGPLKPAPPPPSSKPPLIAKWKPGAKLLGQSDSDELYEGLKRAQRSRLEDQRGTEINFELPDFLKDKENAPQGNKKLRKFLQPRRDVGGNNGSAEAQAVTSSRESLLATPLSHSHAPFCLDSLLGVGSAVSEPDVHSASDSLQEGGSTSSLLNHSFGSDAMIPPPQQAQEFFQGCIQPASLPTSLPASLPPLTRLSDPPPLPPKPKYLRPPALPRVPGGEITNRQDAVPAVPTTRRIVYLDQATSSFV